MKHLRKESKKPLPIIIVSVLITVVIAIIIVLIPKNKVNEMPKNNSENSESTVNETQKEEIDNSKTENLSASNITETVIKEPSKPIVRDYVLVELNNGVIETPYTKINYPENLSDNLVVINTSLEPYVLEFYAVLENRKEVRLFDISLGLNSGGNMGMIKTDEGNIPLNVKIYTIPKDEALSESEITTLYAMQDAVNDILNELNVTSEKEPDSSVLTNQPEDSGTISNMKIETPYCPLYYPSKYSESMYYESSDSENDIYKVHFYSKIEEMEDNLLFSLYFGGDEGEQIGAIKNDSGNIVPVYLVMNELEVENYSEEQVVLLYSMQEACNELIEKLPLIES